MCLKQSISALVDSWVTSTGVACRCPPLQPPAKRGRGRPPGDIGGCRSCWRSLTADRVLPPPHNLSLATRCLHELRYDHPDLEARAVDEALKTSLLTFGFRLTNRTTARLPLRDGSSTDPITGWTVWGWRDRRDVGYMYVKESGIPNSGGGAFASTKLKKGDWLGRFTGVSIKASALRESSFEVGYVKRVGGPYISARDPDGRLRLSDGQLVNSHQFTDVDWKALAENPGVAWEGIASLSRFIQHKPAAGDTNVIIRGSDVFATCDVPRER